jgi:hypothetical protein
MEDDLRLGFQHEFSVIVEHRKIMGIGPTQSSSDTPYTQVNKINKFYLTLITCAVYSLLIWAINIEPLCFKHESHNTHNSQDG